ncbi:hypothetical protein ABPG72_012123 [Tetrahymena utriculariae]
MPKATSQFTRGIIIVCQTLALSYKKCLEVLEKIQAKSTEEVLCSLQTIRSMYSKWINNSQVNTKYENCGTSNKTTPRQAEKIVKEFQQNPAQSLRKCANDPKINESKLSHENVRKVFKENDLNAFRVPTVQFMTQNHKAERLQFAKSKQSWKGKWKDVLFSDEVILKKEKIQLSREPINIIPQYNKYIAQYVYNICFIPFQKTTLIPYSFL